MDTRKLTGFLAGLSLAALSIISVPRAQACVSPDNSGYSSSPFVIVHSLSTDHWGNGVAYDETLDFWDAYLKGSVNREAIKDFFDHATVDSLTSDRNAFMRRLKKNGDKAAIDYIRRCLQLSEAIEKYQQESWRYEKPTKAGFEKLLSEVEAVEAPAAFRPRYEFLKIRIHGAMGNNDGVMDVWTRSGKSMKPSALRNRMEGYVGGVLYRQGKYVDALDYFYRTGDDASISWCIDKLAGAANLKSLYEHSPNSTALRYIVQDYMNYLIATSNAGRRYDKGKMNGSESDYYEYTVYDDDLRDIVGKPIYNAAAQRGEMMKLFKRILDENKTDTPMLWATALGIIQTMDGRTEEGLATLKRAASLKGDSVLKCNLDNFTLWALMLNSGKGDAACEAEFVDRLKEAYASLSRTASMLTYSYSKQGRAKREDYFSSRVNQMQSNFLTEFFVLEATTHFVNLKQPHRALGILAMFDALPPGLCGDEFMGWMRREMDKNLTLDEAKRFSVFAISPSQATGVIDAHLQPYAARCLNLINDVIGTRLMRQMQFDEALTYLEKVDPRWIRTQAIYPYLRSEYFNPMYYNFRRNRTSPEYYVFGSDNTKASFCSEMIQALEDYENLKGKEKAVKALVIAAMMHFASPMGDGWALSEYGWSIYFRENEFSEAALAWLKKVEGLTDDAYTRSIAAYALLNFPGMKKEGDFGLPFGSTRNRDGNIDKYFLSMPTDSQREALDYLKRQWGSVDDMPEYITHCDVLESYMAGNFIARPKSDW